MKYKNHKTGENLLSGDKYMGFGEVELEENEKSQTVMLTMDVLESAIKALKEFGLECASFRVETNKPVLITSAPEDETKPQVLRGLLIAPRVWD